MTSSTLRAFLLKSLEMTHTGEISPSELSAVARVVRQIVEKARGEAKSWK